MIDDLEMIEKIVHGCSEYFEILMKKYESKVINLVYNLIKNKESAEDITQDVFITVYYKLYLFNKKSSLSTWIYKIAYNKSIDFIRKNKKKDIVNSDIVPLTTEFMSPEHNLELSETKLSIKNFVSSLKDVDKRILTLRCSDDNLTFNDIAVILDMSESNVKKRYYKIYQSYEKYTGINNSLGIERG